jgi:hypothetical protein
VDHPAAPVIPLRDDRPFTLPEARAALVDLAEGFRGEPGADLLALAVQILDNTTCHCAAPAAPPTLADVRPLRRQEPLA